MARANAHIGQGDKPSRLDGAYDEVPGGHVVDHLREPADGAIGGDQRAVGAAPVAGRRAVDEQPGRDLLDEDRFAGHRLWGPYAPTVSGGLDIQGPTELSRHSTAVPHQVGDGVRVAVDPATVPTGECHRVPAHRLHMDRAVVVGE